jgi:prepilin-type processing-associated H-X9-DG protein
MKRTSLARRHGLTLFQLLLLLAALLFLLGLLLPLVARIRAAAQRAQSTNNLKQLALAAHNFHDVNKAFPPAIGPFAPARAGTAHFYLLPYVEQQALYNAAEGSSWNDKIYSVIVPVFVAPEDTSGPEKILYEGQIATTNYAANWMVFKKGGTSLVNITDGTSNTLMFAERYRVCHSDPCAWAYPTLYYWAPLFGYYSYGKFQAAPSQEECNPALPQALTPQGINVAMCDGSVRLVAPTISPRTWWLVTDPADGEVIGPDF